MLYCYHYYTCQDLQSFKLSCQLVIAYYLQLFLLISVCVNEIWSYIHCNKITNYTEIGLFIATDVCARPCVHTVSRCRREIETGGWEIIAKVNADIILIYFNISGRQRRIQSRLIVWLLFHLPEKASWKQSCWRRKKPV